MPIFEYKCKDCGNIFEELIGPTEPEGSPLCPKCGSDKCQKLFSAFASTVGHKNSQNSSNPTGCPPNGCGFT